MNSDQLQGKWKQMKGTVKERWGKLTDDDLTMLSGKSNPTVNDFVRYSGRGTIREFPDVAAINNDYVLTLNIQT